MQNSQFVEALYTVTIRWRCTPIPRPSATADHEQCNGDTYTVPADRPLQRGQRNTGPKHVALNIFISAKQCLSITFYFFGNKSHIFWTDAYSWRLNQTAQYVECSISTEELNCTNVPQLNQHHLGVRYRSRDVKPLAFASIGLEHCMISQLFTITLKQFTLPIYFKFGPEIVWCVVRIWILPVPSV